MNLSCIIIDDEPSGRKVMREYISETPFLELVGEAEHPVKAISLLENHSVDLIFLDIQMPKINGIDFLKTLKNPPMVILTTAFSEYALQGFELDVIDYLLKPISLDRFIKASSKARDFLDMHRKGKESAEYFFVKCKSKFERVLYDDLLFVEAANNYVILTTHEQRMVTYLTFKGIEEALPPEQFIKVHKSFIVSLSKVENLDAEQIKIGQYMIPISRSLKDEVMQRIVNSRLVKR